MGVQCLQLEKQLFYSNNKKSPRRKHNAHHPSKSIPLQVTFQHAKHRTLRNMLYQIRQNY